MNQRSHLAIIGSGASAIYLLKHLLDEAGILIRHLAGISIFEKSSITGMGMPYNPLTTDRFNMSNISSEELPPLPESFADWLRLQDPALLKELGVESGEISEDAVYSRLALGRYLNAQYKTMIHDLEEAGIAIREFPGCEIIDVRCDPQQANLTLDAANGDSYGFDRVIIATGHCWTEEDKPGEGYYASPWPISKLLPDGGTFHNFAIGTLGASLSAFDVITSLAHRHGNFTQEEGKMVFLPFPGTEEFKIVMHASHGLLPHLQYDQNKPIRQIYRHVDRESLLALVDDEGFLSLDTFFDKVCRPALTEAFAKDGMDRMVALLRESQFDFSKFVETMTARHDYPDAFEGMRHEMNEARRSVLEHKPIHWKEVIDDLMYTLNFHAELLPAEDHLTLRSTVMPFLMNVIAAMPLPSGETLLALRDAGKLDLVAGRVEIQENSEQYGKTTITVTDDGDKETLVYPVFVDCSGQKPLELEDYPFQGLVRSGHARRARARFRDPENTLETLPDEKKEAIFREGDVVYCHIGGVDVDGVGRLIGTDGVADPRIFDIAFPHTSGVRPYSYGLQACSDTGAILVAALVEELRTGAAVEGDLESVTEIYEIVDAD